MSAIIGLRDLHYAKVIKDGDETTYDEPVPIRGLIEAAINPNPSMETLFADDGPMDTASTLGQIELEIRAADLPTAVRAELLGHTVDSHGIMTSKSGDTPPWVAIGFRALKSSGAYRYMWLMKGKFQEPETDFETRGDSVNFQTPSITGSFVKRDSDDAWKREVDGDDADFNEAIAAGWFTSPDFTPGA